MAQDALTLEEIGPLQPGPPGFRVIEKFGLAVADAKLLTSSNRPQRVGSQGARSSLGSLRDRHVWETAALAVAAARRENPCRGTSNDDKAAMLSGV